MYELSTFVAGVFWPEYSYISKRVKIGHPTNQATSLCEKIPFINATQHLFMGVNKMCVKNITVTVSIRVSVTFRVSLGWFVSSKSLVALSVAIS